MLLESFNFPEFNGKDGVDVMSVHIYSDASECTEDYHYSVKSLQSKPYLIQKIKEFYGKDALKDIPIKSPYAK